MIRTLLAEAEKARFWKRLTERRAANMMDGLLSVGRRRREGEGEKIPVRGKEIGRGVSTTPGQVPSSRSRLVTGTSLVLHRYLGTSMDELFCFQLNLFRWEWNGLTGIWACVVQLCLLAVEVFFLKTRGWIYVYCSHRPSMYMGTCLDTRVDMHAYSSQVHTHLYSIQSQPLPGITSIYTSL